MVIGRKVRGDWGSRGEYNFPDSLSIVLIIQASDYHWSPTFYFSLPRRATFGYANP